MADNTGIEWCDSTWNPVVGCSIVSPGCTNCYAMKLAGRLEKMGSAIYRGHTQPSKAGAVWNGKASLSNWGQVIKPLSWRRPRRIFVNSMSDLFHENLPDEAIDKVFAVMALCPQHTFQVLTKRAGRMRAYASDRARPGQIARCCIDMMIAGQTRPDESWPVESIGNIDHPDDVTLRVWPLPNVWLGTSVEDQATADERIPALLDTPAAARFLSCEPLLGPVDLRRYLVGHEEAGLVGNAIGWTPPVDWVIAGGESGPGARPMHPDWARSTRDQCAATSVAFFFKQWGQWIPEGQTARSAVKIDLYRRRWCTLSDGDDRYTPDAAAVHPIGKKAAGRLLDGVEHSEFPQTGER